MRIALIQQLYYEYLGLMYISASLKREGHAVEVFLCPNEASMPAFIEEIAAYRPDIAGFSVLSGNEELALSIARRIKKRMNVYSVFGGPHPTAVPEIIENDGVDCVCLGEAETSFVSIAGALADGKIPRRIPGAWFKIEGTIVKNDLGDPVQNLDTLPRPDRSLYRNKYRFLRNRWASFIAGRGCPYRCAFCSSPHLMKLYRGKGPFVRQRSVSDVIDEIRQVKEGYGIKAVSFEDDTFVLRREWILKFCDAYQRDIRLPFSCHIRADLATEEMISSLARAQCRTISFGIETGNSRMRNRLLNKEVTDDQIIACAGLLKQYGIRFRTLNILGLPGETIEESFQTVALNARIKPDYPWCALFQPLPATALWEHSAERRLFEEGAARTQPSFFSGSPLILRNKREIENLHKLFIYAVRFPMLQGIIRMAIRAKPNACYKFLFALAHAWVFLRSSMAPVCDAAMLGLMNFARYLPRKGRRRSGSDSVV